MLAVELVVDRVLVLVLVEVVELDVDEKELVVVLSVDCVEVVVVWVLVDVDVLVLELVLVELVDDELDDELVVDKVENVELSAPMSHSAPEPPRSSPSMSVWNA